MIEVVDGHLDSLATYVRYGAALEEPGECFVVGFQYLDLARFRDVRLARLGRHSEGRRVYRDEQVRCRRRCKQTWVINTNTAGSQGSGVTLKEGVSTETNRFGVDDAANRHGALIPITLVLFCKASGHR